jgi:hypothetical protein
MFHGFIYCFNVRDWKDHLVIILPAITDLCMFVALLKNCKFLFIIAESKSGVRFITRLLKYCLLGHLIQPSLIYSMITFFMEMFPEWSCIIKKYIPAFKLDNGIITGELPSRFFISRIF